MECTNCGKETKDIVDELCVECVLKKIPIVRSMKQIKISICSNCGAYSTHKGFRKGGSIRDIVKVTVEKSLKPDPRYTNARFLTKFTVPVFKMKPRQKLSFEVEVVAKALLDNIHVKEDYVFPIHIKTATCDKCSKEGSGYFEGILQLRNTDNKNYETALEYIKNSMEKVRKLSIFATKYVDVKNGVDIYITKRQFIQKLANNVFGRFGGEVKQNANLFSRDNLTSKRIYRLSVLIRLPDFAVGDILKIKRDYVRVKKVIGKKVMGNVLSKDSVKGFDYVNNDYKIAAKKSELKQTTVDKIYPKLEVLHPETYQSVEIKNPKKNIKIGQEVTVFVNGGVWLV